MLLFIILTEIHSQSKLDNVFFHAFSFHLYANTRKNIKHIFLTFSTGSMKDNYGHHKIQKEHGYFEII